LQEKKVILYPYGFLSIFKPFVESSLDDVCLSLQKAVFSVCKLRKVRLFSMDHRRMLKTGEFLAYFQWNRSKNRREYCLGPAKKLALGFIGDSLLELPRYLGEKVTCQAADVSS